MKIVVANSVGIDSEGYYMIHSPSRWTTGVKRSPFTFYPWELAYTSALLKRDTQHQVKFVDGCLNRLDYEGYLSLIEKERPDLLVMESSSRTIQEDLRLAMALKQRCGTKLFMAGQHATAFPEEVARVADYVALGEYEYQALEVAQGKEPGEIRGLYPGERRALLDVNSLPWPEDEDVSRLDYSIPPLPNLNHTLIQMYASRGCPMTCSFCVCSNLYYEKPNWRKRDIPDIIKEIAYLRQKYPHMEGIFFDEEVHYIGKPFVLQLTKAIEEAGLSDLKYAAMGGYWNLDEEMLLAMKGAGYYQLRMGIETASEKIAREIGLKPKFDLDKLYHVLKAAKGVDMDIYGTFMIGAPGSSYEEDEKTIRLIKDLLVHDLLCDIQVSLCTPQPGTPFFRWAEEMSYLVTHDWRLYDGGQGSVVSYPHYPKEKIDEAYQRAVDESHYWRFRGRLKREGPLRAVRHALNRVGAKGIMGFLKRKYLRG